MKAYLPLTDVPGPVEYAIILPPTLVRVEILFTGDSLAADEATRLNRADHVVPHEKLFEGPMPWCAKSWEMRRWPGAPPKTPLRMIATCHGGPGALRRGAQRPNSAERRCQRGARSLP
jgi:enoyl-CoA hydratase/carnithine racemase